MPPGFQSRVNTNVVPVQARQGGGVGGAIAEGIAQLGKVGGQIAAQDAQVQERIADSDARIAEVQRRREISAHSADRIGAWAQLQADVGNELMDVRTRSKPGAVGHKEEAIKLIRSKMDDFLGTLAEEPEVRERFEPMLIEFEARTLLNEGEWELQKRAKHQGDSWASYVDVAGNQVMLDPTPGRYQQTIMDGEAALELMDVDGTEKAALREKLVAATTEKLRDGMLQAGQIDQLEALAKSGFLNDKGIDLNRTFKMLDIEKREKQQAVEEAAMLQREAAREVAKQIDARIDGGEIIDPKSMAAAAAAMRAAGVKESEVIAFENKTVEARVNQTYNPQADPMGTQASMAASALEAKIFSGKATPDEERRYKHLKKIGDTRATEFGKNLKQTAAQGVQGKQQVLGQIDAMDVSQRFTAAEAAAQGLGQVAFVKSQAREAVLSGMEDIVANPKIIDQKLATKQFERQTKSASFGLSQETQQNIKRVANGYYAYYAKQAGLGPDEFNPAIYDAAIKVASGAETRDGIWYGGIQVVRGRSVALPDNYTAGQFDAMISRIPNAAFESAVHRNGGTASKSDILSNYLIVYQGPTDDGYALYHFRDPNGNILSMKNKRPFPLKVPLKAR
jgi:hypothetical protein